MLWNLIRCFSRTGFHFEVLTEVPGRRITIYLWNLNFWKRTKGAIKGSHKKILCNGPPNHPMSTMFEGGGSLSGPTIKEMFREWNLNPYLLPYIITLRNRFKFSFFESTQTILKTYKTKLMSLQFLFFTYWATMNTLIPWNTLNKGYIQLIWKHFLSNWEQVKNLMGRGLAPPPESVRGRGQLPPCPHPLCDQPWVSRTL